MVLQLTDNLKSYGDMLNTGEPDESSVKRFRRADLLLSTIDPRLILSHVACVSFSKDCIDRECFMVEGFSILYLFSWYRLLFDGVMVPP